MKRKFIMMPVLIQGPKKPRNDIDVYLRPLVEEFLQLWNGNGVCTWDEHRQEEFNLKALLFVTINDWPALSNLSGQTNKGYHACTHCLDDTESIYLDKCRKNVITGTHGGLLPVICLAFEMLAFLSTLMVGRKKSTMAQVHILPAFIQVYTFSVI